MNTSNTEPKQNHKPKWQLQSGVLQVTCWDSAVRGEDRRDSSFLTVTIQRSFKDKGDQWQRTQTLRRQDLLPMARLLEQAYDKLNAKEE